MSVAETLLLQKTPNKHLREKYDCKLVQKRNCELEYFKSGTYLNNILANLLVAMPLTSPFLWEVKLGMRSHAWFSLVSYFALLPF